MMTMLRWDTISLGWGGEEAEECECEDGECEDGEEEEEGEEEEGEEEEGGRGGGRGRGEGERAVEFGAQPAISRRRVCFRALLRCLSSHFMG